MAPLKTRVAIEALRAQREVAAPVEKAAPEVEQPKIVEQAPKLEQQNTSQYSQESFRVNEEIQKAALQARQAEARLQEALKRQQEIETAAKDPMKFLRDQYPDLSQEDFNMMVLTGKAPPEMETKKLVKNEVDEVRQEINKIRQELEIKERKVQAENMMAQYTQQYAQEFPLVEELGGAKFVLSAAIQHHKNTGEYLTLPQMAEKIEKYELEKAQKLIQKASQVGKYGISGNTAPRSDVSANIPRTLSSNTVPQTTNNPGQESHQDLMIRLNKLLLGL